MRPWWYLDKTTSALHLVDECGCIWNRTLEYGTRPHPHFKIGVAGTGWSRLGGLRMVTVSLLVLHMLAGMRIFSLVLCVIRMMCCPSLSELYFNVLSCFGFYNPQYLNVPLGYVVSLFCLVCVAQGFLINFCLCNFLL